MRAQRFGGSPRFRPRVVVQRITEASGYQIAHERIRSLLTAIAHYSCSYMLYQFPTYRLRFTVLATATLAPALLSSSLQSENTCANLRFSDGKCTVLPCEAMLGNMSYFWKRTDALQSSTNPWHNTYCFRSDIILQHLQSALNFASIELNQSSTILSYASSIGVEAAALQAIYPTASIFGYDIDPPTIAMASRISEHWCNCEMNKVSFTWNRSSLMNNTFDLVLGNNFLMENMNTSTFASIFDDMYSLVRKGGILEFSVWDPPLDKYWASHPFRPYIAYRYIYAHYLSRCTTFRVAQTTCFLCKK